MGENGCAERICLRPRPAPCCIVAVGDEVTPASYSRKHRQEYRQKIQVCLDVFETMLAKSRFDFDRPLTGMEIECNLVGSAYQPAMSNQEVLAAIANPAYQTELGAYNIEFNVRPALSPAVPPWNWRRRSAPASTPPSPRPVQTVRTS